MSRAAGLGSPVWPKVTCPDATSLGPDSALPARETQAQASPFSGEAGRVGPEVLPAQARRPDPTLHPTAPLCH